MSNQSTNFDDIVQKMYSTHRDALLKMPSLVFLSLKTDTLRLSGNTNTQIVHNHSLVYRAVTSAFLEVCYHRSLTSSPIRTLSLQTNDQCIVTPALTINQICAGMVGIRHMVLNIPTKQALSTKDSEQEHGSIAGLIQAAPNLRRLEINGHYSRHNRPSLGEYFWDANIQEWHHWPKLEYLMLCLLIFHLDEILQFLELHKEMLKEVVFDFCVFTNDEPSKTYENLLVVEKYLRKTFPGRKFRYGGRYCLRMEVPMQK